MRLALATAAVETPERSSCAMARPGAPCTDLFLKSETIYATVSNPMCACLSASFFKAVL